MSHPTNPAMSAPSSAPVLLLLIGLWFVLPLPVRRAAKRKETEQISPRR